jgi:hypothetical protein
MRRWIAASCGSSHGSSATNFGLARIAIHHDAKLSDGKFNSLIPPYAMTQRSVLDTKNQRAGFGALVG